ncbi:MAG: FHA domain-containing protein [Candidatus Melainabacteria bacterium]|nr:FHA domain-containing protein [Candidatus Melainabacteria bacterium]
MDEQQAFLIDLLSKRKYPIATPCCRVGRDKLNQIVISGDESISRFHFTISKQNDSYTIEDSKSQYGTFLNSKRLEGPEPLKDGDVVKIGVSLFWFQLQ